MRVESIGFELTAARRRAGLTQREVAERMGTTQSAVSRVESGRVAPSLDFLDRYARAIGTRLAVELGPRPAEEPPDAGERADLVRRVLRGFVFDPWQRDPSPAERRSLEIDGLTRERFQSQAPSR
ncbi:MAG: helix-turn-helix domain-containing protein [Candidatus Binatia bacterium]